MEPKVCLVCEHPRVVNLSDHLIRSGGGRCSGQWPGLAGASLILLYFCGEPRPIKAIFSGRGKIKKGFLYVTLCDMKMDGQLDL